jgi:flagellar biosynthetic protein FliP
MAPAATAGLELGDTQHHPNPRRGVLPFLGHLAEMTVVMVAGMAVLYGMSGASDVASPELRALLMVGSMTLPMAGWMRLRGHSWRSATVMTVAMAAPVLVLLPLLWADLITGRALVGAQHVTMLPSMLAAMLIRRQEYGL